uniref:Putative secreted protein n=1 Tax=Anopheles darlingi TaxID=43151 RepID=A0A2M4DKA6_ANODA
MSASKMTASFWVLLQLLTDFLSKVATMNALHRKRKCKRSPSGDRLSGTGSTPSVHTLTYTLIRVSTALLAKVLHSEHPEYTLHTVAERRDLRQQYLQFYWHGT